MNLSSADVEGSSTIASAEARVFLANGETDRAREKFAEAGHVLEENIVNVRKQSTKHLVRFLAATQYYKGGHYATCLAICQKIQPSLLQSEMRHVYADFLRDVKVRSSPDYVINVRNSLLRSFAAGDHASVLALLRQHPYILTQGQLAYARAGSCEKLEKFQEAALFFADALKWSDSHPEVIFTSAAYPLVMVKQGRLREAWAYVELLMNAIPHCATYITASLIRYNQAASEPDDNKRTWSESQLELFEQAWRKFQSLPTALQQDANFRDYMILCFDAAAFAHLRLEDQTSATKICTRAIEFNPSSDSPWTVRGIITYPNPSGVADFEEAVRLGSRNFMPYYSLAHAALTRGEYGEVLAWIERALALTDNPQFRAILFAWQGVASWETGESKEVVLRLFDVAQKLDPENKDLERLIRDAQGSAKRGIEPKRYAYNATLFNLNKEQNEMISKRDKATSGSHQFV